MRTLAVKTLAVLLLLVLASFLLGTEPFQQKYELLYVIGHRVIPGETLWEIASKYYDLQDKPDSREFIFDIREYNGITPVIHPGQIIEIPIYKKVNY